MNEIIHSLDVRGMNCPLPILKTRKAIAALASGEILEINTTDPGSVKDMDSFCTQTGNEMIASEALGDGFIFRIRKACKHP